MNETNKSILFIIPLVFVFALLLTAFQIDQTENSQIKKRLGKAIYPTIESAGSITFSKVKPTIKTADIEKIEYQEPFINLNFSDKNALLTLLLNDNNYIFDAAKKNIFVAQYILIFKSLHDEVYLFINTSDSQVKFQTKDTSVTLDFDPAKDHFNHLINTLLNNHPVNHAY